MSGRTIFYAVSGSSYPWDLTQIDARYHGQTPQGINAFLSFCGKILSMDEHDACQDAILIGPFRGDDGQEPILSAAEWTMEDFENVDLKCIRTHEVVQVVGGVADDSWCIAFLEHSSLRPGFNYGHRLWPADGTSYIVEQRSVLHVLLASTRGRMDPTTLWATVRAIASNSKLNCACGIVPGISYGIISLAHAVRFDRYAYLEPWNMAMASQDPHELVAPFNWFTRLYMRTDLSDEEKIWEAVMGTGNMWVAYRPDRFPMKRAFDDAWAPAVFQRASEAPQASDRLSTLPLELLSGIAAQCTLHALLQLLASCKSIREAIQPHLDHITGQVLSSQYPEYLPHAVSSELKIDEMGWWTTELAAARQRCSADAQAIPWMSYARACFKYSPSMRNRQRIWGIARQFETLATQHGILSAHDC